MQAVDLLQVSLQENDAASCPKVPHPAERIQPADWTRAERGGATDREGEMIGPQTGAGPQRDRIDTSHLIKPTQINDRVKRDILYIQICYCSTTTTIRYCQKMCC